MIATLEQPPASASASSTIHVVLAGNPNAGKTSIYNALTGANQKVANYPGVTVETIEGGLQHNGRTFRVIDLPGTYSLTANSPEERIARNYIIDQAPDVVVQVIDAANLERSLYLTEQLRELSVPLVLDLNMIDEAEARGMRIDDAALARLMGVEIVRTVGNRGTGVQDLLAAIERAAGSARTARPLHFAPEIQRVIDKFAYRLGQASGAASRFPLDWAAVKILEGDREIGHWLQESVPDGPAIYERAGEDIRRLTGAYGESIESLVANARYANVARTYRQVASQVEGGPHSDFTARIDALLLNKWLGLPIFMVIMFAMFQFTFTLGQPFMDLIETGFGALAGWTAATLPDGPLRSLLVDGVIAGVGGVIVFLPNILFLFFFIGLLEKSGYMARAAFLMDRLMNKVGLHGRSFIPMLSGFGCSIPAIMATRTLEHERDRLATMMVIPMMSCSARLTVYSLLIPAFFPLHYRGLVFFSMYAVGILLAVVIVKLLRVSLLKGDSTPLVMELPPYRRPTLRSILRDMWTKSQAYLRKAGTIILAISIILWAMASFPQKSTFAVDSSPQAATMSAEQLDAARSSEALAYSAAGRLGTLIQPLFAPMGFDWKICTALVGAAAAKEVFVAQMGIVFALGDTESEAGSDSLRQTLQAGYSPLVAYCIMLFCLLSFPCISTFAIVKRESNSWKWPILQSVSYTLIAYVLTLVVYQVGSALGWGV